MPLHPSKYQRSKVVYNLSSFFSFSLHTFRACTNVSWFRLFSFTISAHWDIGHGGVANQYEPSVQKLSQNLTPPTKGPLEEKKNGKICFSFLHFSFFSHLLKSSSSFPPTFTSFPVHHSLVLTFFFMFFSLCQSLSSGTTAIKFYTI